MPENLGQLGDLRLLNTLHPLYPFYVEGTFQGLVSFDRPFSFIHLKYLRASREPTESQTL